MRVAYFDCFSGASGDMILGALLDAGLDLSALQQELSKLHIHEYELTAEPAKQHEITGTKAHVKLTSSHSHHHRHLPDILGLIEGSSLDRQVKDSASLVFQRLGEAEAIVHGVGIEEIHFHEVGAVDAIVDIVGSVIGLQLLGVEKVYSSPLPLGSGFVDCAHGRIPIPAPATLELISAVKAPIKDLDIEAELLTPTGAALITTLAEFRRPEMNIERVGYGFGGRQLPWPNALRIWIGEETEREAEPVTEQMTILETNIDDMNPEIYGYLMERLFQAGAVDVYYTPIYMKKNRPAVMLSVLAPTGIERTMMEIIITETTTLGVRSRRVDRCKADREERTIETSFGSVRLKVKKLKGKTVGFAPEYEDCAAIARAKNMPLLEVYRIVQNEAGKL